MLELSTHTGTELAHRSSAGVDVTLVWFRSAGRDGQDNVVVRVSDAQQGAYFEIRAEPHLALDVYYHPFAYRDVALSTTKTVGERRSR